MSDSKQRRDQAWLDKLLERTWDEYFSDVEKVNHIRIAFGRRARRRLGSISIDRHDDKYSLIRVNGWFREEVVPEYIVQSVIVHELCHYAHGFNSGAARPAHKHPHAGGVVRREFAERGLEGLYDRQQTWLKEHWPAFIQERYADSQYVKRRPKGNRRLARILYQFVD